MDLYSLVFDVCVWEVLKAPPCKLPDLLILAAATLFNPALGSFLFPLDPGLHVSTQLKSVPAIGRIFYLITVGLSHSPPLSSL